MSLKEAIRRHAQRTQPPFINNFSRLAILAWDRSDGEADRLCKAISDAQAFRSLCRTCPMESEDTLKEYLRQVENEWLNNEIVCPDGVFLLLVSDSGRKIPDLSGYRMRIQTVVCTVAGEEDNAPWRIAPSQNNMTDSLAALLLVGLLSLEGYTGDVCTSVDASMYSSVEQDLALQLKGKVEAQYRKNATPEQCAEPLKETFSLSESEEKELLRCIPKLTELPMVGTDALIQRLPRKCLFFKKKNQGIPVKNAIDILFGRPDGKTVVEWVQGEAQRIFEDACENKIPFYREKGYLLPIGYLWRAWPVIQQTKETEATKLEKYRNQLDAALRKPFTAKGKSPEDLAAALRDAEVQLTKTVQTICKVTWWNQVVRVLEADSELMQAAETKADELQRDLNVLTYMNSAPAPEQNVPVNWLKFKAVDALQGLYSPAMFSDEDLINVAKKAEKKANNIHASDEKVSRLLLNTAVFDRLWDWNRKEEESRRIFREVENDEGKRLVGASPNTNITVSGTECLDPNVFWEIHLTRRRLP